MFGEFNVDKELDNLLKRNGFTISADDYVSITKIYNATIKEQSKQYSNYTDRVKLLEGILQQTRQGASPEDIFQTFSDVRHYELYENFMGTSERRRMINILKENGIPLDILKGVRIDEKGDQLHPLPNITIDYKFSIDEHGSLYLEYFEITDSNISDVNGNLFTFENQKAKHVTPKEERSAPREVKGRSSKYVARIANTCVGDVKEWIDKNGRTFYTDSRGHRVKVRDGVVQERILWEEE